MNKNGKRGIVVVTLALLFNTVSAYGQGYLDNSFSGQQTNNYPPYNNQPATQNQYSTPPAYPQAPQLKGYVVTVPAGTPVNATVQSTISSEFASVGTPIFASLANDLYVGGQLALPAGSQLEGQVVNVIKAGRMGKNGTLEIRFTNAIAPQGQRIPISGKIVTNDGTGIIKGEGNGITGTVAKNTAVGAAGGALFGTAMGAAVSGRPGRGAWLGTAIGGGSGLLKGVSQRGIDAVLNAGTPLNLRLDQPFTVNSYSAPAYAQQNQGYGY